VAFVFCGVVGWPSNSYTAWSNGFTNEYQSESVNGFTAILVASHPYTSIPGSPPSSGTSFTNVIKIGSFAVAFKGT
jgi:hypothetical protein